jgi:Contractile injection system tape measure protein
MQAGANHIVKRVVYTVKGIPVDKAFSVKEEAAEYIQRSFSNRLGVLLDKYFPGDEYVYIDKLKLDVVLQPGNYAAAGLENQLLNTLETELQKQAVVNRTVVSDNIDTYAADNINIPQYSPVAVFEFFLQNGHLPWWHKITTPGLFEQTLLNHLAQAEWQAINRIARTITVTAPQILQRFIQQFTDNFKYQLAGSWLRQDGVTVEAIFKKLAVAITSKASKGTKRAVKLGVENKKITASQPLQHDQVSFIFWNTFWKMIEAADSAPGLQQLEVELETVRQSLTSVSKHKGNENTQLMQDGKTLADITGISEDKNGRSGKIGADRIEPEPDRQQVEKMSESGNFVYVNNAGLVIFHPFINTLFNDLMIAKDGVIIWPGKAIAVLNYLCGYEVLQPEYEWPLMKILCGLSISAVVENVPALSETDKLECMAMMQQAIDHWSALKQTSIEALQQTYIQRFGKLSNKNGAWLLQVEQKTVDVLMNNMPWGISMCKLPWMQQILTTEW